MSLGVVLRSLTTVLSALTVFGFLKYSLNMEASRYLEEFRIQNSIELSRGDVFPIARRLGAIAKNEQFICIVGNKNGNIFFEDRNGKCGTGLFRTKEFLFDDIHKIEIAFTLGMQSELVLGYLLFLAIQILLAASIFWSERKFFLFGRKKDLELAGIARQIGHDIRSPLAILKTTINEKGESSEAVILGALNRLEELGKHLLSGKIRPHRIIFAGQLLRETIEEKRAEFGETISIVENISLSKNCILPGDAFQWRRMLSNLVNNSHEAKVSNKAYVSILAEESDDRVTIIIRDNGKGISREIMGKIGEVGFSHGKADGNGLGIHSAKEFLQTIDGRLSLGPPDGGGCEVVIEVPKFSKIVLIDNDEELGDLWAMVARRSGIPFEFILFRGVEQLPEPSSQYIYFIDFFLDADAKSVFRAGSRLRDRGARQIIICTGKSKEDIQMPDWASGITGKEPPF